MSCPVCGRPVLEPHRPFCSRRCRLIDLGAWLTEKRGIPVPPEELVEEDFADAEGEPDPRDEDA